MQDESILKKDIFFSTFNKVGFMLHIGNLKLSYGIILRVLKQPEKLGFDERYWLYYLMYQCEQAI